MAGLARCRTDQQLPGERGELQAASLAAGWQSHSLRAAPQPELRPPAANSTICLRGELRDATLAAAWQALHADVLVQARGDPDHQLHQRKPGDRRGPCPLRSPTCGQVLLYACLGDRGGPVTSPISDLQLSSSRPANPGRGRSEGASSDAELSGTPSTAEAAAAAGPSPGQLIAPDAAAEPWQEEKSK